MSRRVGGLYPLIHDRENLRLAYAAALRGKRHQAEVISFQLALEENLDRLAAELRAESVSIGAYRQFSICDPKHRVITAPAFRERILHHAIMNVCGAYFEQWLPDDSFACRVGKGRLKAIARAQYFARRHRRYVHLDIRKYFNSVSHDCLMRLLKRRFKDTALLLLFERIIGSFSVSPGRGLPIGCLTSQHFANFFLSHLDRFVRETLRVQAYVRYMDDFVLWGDTGALLRKHQASIAGFLAESLGLHMKEEVRVRSTTSGLEFLGLKVFPNRLTLARRSRRRYARRVRECEVAFLRGGLTELELQRRAQALTSFTRTPGVRSCRLRQSVVSQSLVDDHWPRTG